MARYGDGRRPRRAGRTLSTKAATVHLGDAMTVHAPITFRAQDAAQVTTEASFKSLTLAVENMHCGGCMRSVERAALGVAGVASARANLSAQRVSVAYDPARTGEPALIEALARAGFPAAPMQWVKPGAEQARQKYLLRRTAVAGFAAMNIMLI